MNTGLRSCPICASSERKVLHSQEFVLPEGHPMSRGYDVVCCINCGFVYADTNTVQEDYDMFYARFSKYEDSQASTGAGETPWDIKRLQETAEQIKYVLADTESRILDIGCANGGLLKSLRGCLKSG